MFVHCSESLGLDSVNALDSESAFDCVLSTFAFVDSVIVFESALESLDSVLPRISALDSVDSLFLRVAFSRIFSNFLESRVCAKRKGVYPLPAPLSPEKAAAVFAALCLQAFGTANGESASLILV